MIKVDIIGAGLAGSEAALTLACAGFSVQLFEMRPIYNTPAHTSGYFAELICSNSFKSRELKTALGMMRYEIKHFGGHLYKIAEQQQIAAGTALAVDRLKFSSAVTQAVEDHSNITVVRDLVPNLKPWINNEQHLIIASGPLTQNLLWLKLTELVGQTNSYFYDATAPIVDANTIDRNIVFELSRWNKNIDKSDETEAGSYLNCPMDKDQYLRFRKELLVADLVPLRYGEDLKLFAGCMPIEELARGGESTMRYGPLKPIGLVDPQTGLKPHAVVQLRAENALHSAYNLVGFQTRLKFPEQERIFRMIPGLQNARFLRFGRMHRNSFLNTPDVCDSTLRLKAANNIRIAGQLTGAEGYNCAIATGFLAAQLLIDEIKGRSTFSELPEFSCLGSLLSWLTVRRERNQSFDPTAFNFSMFKYLSINMQKKQRRDRIISDWQQWLNTTAPV